MQALPRRLQFKTVGFPHSDISGSKATNRLPEAFRRLVASFIAVLGQGIHRVLLCLSYGDLRTTLFSICSPRIVRALADDVGHFQLPHFVLLRRMATEGLRGVYLMHIRMSKISVPRTETKTAPRGGFRAFCNARALRPIRS